jgi:hypothetical protein
MMIRPARPRHVHTGTKSGMAKIAVCTGRRRENDGIYLLIVR